MGRQLRKFTEEEKAYVCKFYEIDGPEKLADALDRKYQVVQNLYVRLGKQGKQVYYKQKWDEQFINADASGWF